MAFVSGIAKKLEGPADSYELHILSLCIVQKSVRVPSFPLFSVSRFRVTLPVATILQVYASVHTYGTSPMVPQFIPYMVCFSSSARHLGDLGLNVS